MSVLSNAPTLQNPSSGEVFEVSFVIWYSIDSFKTAQLTWQGLLIDIWVDGQANMHPESV